MDSNRSERIACLLKKFIKASNEKPITEEQVESEYPQFEKLTEVEFNHECYRRRTRSESGDGRRGKISKEQLRTIYDVRRWYYR